jgi:glycosyltransferase involved in cell wall biosynthesis
VVAKPVATVLIPTHNHVEPLRLAIRSVQEQSIEDFELFVVGDGVSEPTRKLVLGLAARDARIRFFDFPKGPRKGEIHRHEALRSATGRIVAYLGDDDIWMPDHLAVLDQLLSECDFGHTMHIGVDASGELFFIPADLQNSALRQVMLSEGFNRFDFTFGGHTLDAYRRLPEGWAATPVDSPRSDLFMWGQFLRQPWCRALSAMIPTGICTQTHLRPNLTDQERADDLAKWYALSREPQFRDALWRKALNAFARDACNHEAYALSWRASAENAASALAAAQEQSEGALTAARSEVSAAEAAAREAEDVMAALTKELAQSQREAAALSARLSVIKASASWRATAPFRELRRSAQRILRRIGN